MKKLILMCAYVMFMMGMLTGCGGADAQTKDDKIDIICTVFPQYDWTRALIEGQEDKYNLTLLTDNGVDMHNYQPSTQDMAMISGCDLFIYVGGESDAWVEDALKNSINANMKVIKLMDIMPDRLQEGHHHEDEADEHEHSEHESDVHNHEEESYDEHVWLSLINAKLVVNEIATMLEEIDKDNASIYRNNCDSYMAKIDALDAKYHEVVDASQTKTLVFADRFPFKYLVADYGIDYFAAFDGCSAETEASFETVAFLAAKIDELGLDTVLVIDGSDKELAEVIISNTAAKNQQIQAIDSMQSIDAADVESGMTYIKVMEDNLEVLKQALAN